LGLPKKVNNYKKVCGEGVGVGDGEGCVCP